MDAAPIAPSAWVSGATSFPKLAFQQGQQEAARIDLEKALEYCKSSSDEEEEEELAGERRQHAADVMHRHGTGGSSRAVLPGPPRPPMQSGQRRPAASSSSDDSGSSGGGGGGKRRRKKDSGKKKKGDKKRRRKESSSSTHRGGGERERFLRAEQRAKASLGAALPERRGGTVWAGGDGALGYALGYSGHDSLDKHLMCTDRWGGAGGRTRTSCALTEWQVGRGGKRTSRRAPY